MFRRPDQDQLRDGSGELRKVKAMQFAHLFAEPAIKGAHRGGPGRHYPFMVVHLQVEMDQIPLQGL